MHHVERYKERHGHYPEAVNVDGIYGTRQNRAMLKERGIHLIGKPLGRPTAESLTAQAIASMRPGQECLWPGLHTGQDQRHQRILDRSDLPGDQPGACSTAQPLAFARSHCTLPLAHLRTALPDPSGVQINIPHTQKPQMDSFLRSWYGIMTSFSRA